MNRVQISLSVLVIGAALLTACGAPPAAGAGPEPTVPPSSTPTPTAPPIVSHGSSVTDYASLLAALRRAGVGVEPGGEVSQPFFSVAGRIVRVDGQDVQVFEYASAEAAEAEAALVDPSGGEINRSIVSWMSTPNFFKTGRLIVLYVGVDALTLDHLMQALGLQFAGGPFAPQGDPAQGGGVSSGDGMLLPAAQAAVQALAAERGVNAGDIQVLSAEPAEWSDSCLGLGRPEQACLLVITPGYLVRLQAGEALVEYRTDELGTVVTRVP